MRQLFLYFSFFESQSIAPKGLITLLSTHIQLSYFNDQKTS